MNTLIIYNVPANTVPLRGGMNGMLPAGRYVLPPHLNEAKSPIARLVPVDMQPAFYHYYVAVCDLEEFAELYAPAKKPEEELAFIDIMDELVFEDQIPDYKQVLNAYLAWRKVLAKETVGRLGEVVGEKHT